MMQETINTDIDTREFPFYAINTPFSAPNKIAMGFDSHKAAEKICNKLNQQIVNEDYSGNRQHWQRDCEAVVYIVVSKLQYLQKYKNSHQLT